MPVHLVAALLVEMQRSGEVESGRRLSKEASAARRLADEIVRKWSNASAANTMGYATSQGKIGKIFAPSRKIGGASNRKKGHSSALLS